MKIRLKVGTTTIRLMKGWDKHGWSTYLQILTFISLWMILETCSWRVHTYVGLGVRKYATLLLSWCHISCFMFIFTLEHLLPIMPLKLFLLNFSSLGNQRQGHLRLVIVIRGYVIDYFSFCDSIKIFQLFNRRQKIS